MDARIDHIYSEFQNFPPNNPIVRNNIRNDAYPIFVLETLFSPYHGVSKFERENEDHRKLLLKSIVPPPDDNIDIFYEIDDLDERSYHIVQVKNTVLRPSEIETYLTMMENSISIYIRTPKTLRKNLRDIIQETSFSKDDKTNCNYYIIHKGSTKGIRNQKKNQTILNFADLKIIDQGTKHNCVPFSTIEIDTVNNFIVNNFIENKNENQKFSNKKPKSLLCNFNGYDLAKLNNEYASTLAGRNILYGQNLREALGGKSKTYDSMTATINTEPELFLFYNNGITILCSDFDAKSEGNKVDIITLKNFSIINGAQTTSTLGAYLKEAAIEENQDKIEKLKKVFVLTKIYEINSSLTEHEEIGEKIRINTNSQTPLSSRDMVSIRKEQIRVQNRFYIDCTYPNIFILIKNGEKPAIHPALHPYQIISNERLAQLCFAGPLNDPFTAKDKRSKLFNSDNQDGLTLNTLYHVIFNLTDGLLFKLSNIQIDELLFIYKLHEDAKRFYRNSLKDDFNHLNQDPIVDDVDRKSRPTRTVQNKRYQEISAVFIFHNITGYYLLKRQYDSSVPNNNNLIFNSRQYYNDKEYRQQIIELFIELVFSRSLRIIAENSGNDNVQNWTRSSAGAEIFKTKFSEDISINSYKIKKKYTDFIAKAKVGISDL
jgi:hypothetical protein